MAQLWIDNYVVNTPIKDILEHLKVVLSNGKLKDIDTSKEDDIRITCPNDRHAGGKENSPDCHITLRTDNPKAPYGWFHCFACGESGSFVKFVALAFSKSEDFAKDWLISNYGERAYEKLDLGEDICVNKKKTKTAYLDKSILDKYQSWHPYLAKRKLSREICEMFQVKYDPENQAVVFPCFDINGGLVMLPTRSINSKVFYLDKGVDKPVYCLDFIVKHNIKTAIVTEGPIDTLTAYQYGFPAIATLGNLSDEQIDKIGHSCIENLYTMFDNDNAGRAFTAKLKAKLSRRIIVNSVQLPAGKKDINDLSYNEFWNCLKKAKNSGDIVV